MAAFPSEVQPETGPKKELHAQEAGRLGGISKRGNQYLRRLLINGASANLLRSKATNADPWVIGLRQRRPPGGGGSASQQDRAHRLGGDAPA